MSNFTPNAYWRLMVTSTARTFGRAHTPQSVINGHLAARNLFCVSHSLGMCVCVAVHPLKISHSGRHAWVFTAEKRGWRRSTRVFMWKGRPQQPGYTWLRRKRGADDLESGRICARVCVRQNRLNKEDVEGGPDQTLLSLALECAAIATKIILALHFLRPSRIACNADKRLALYWCH